MAEIRRGGDLDGGGNKPAFGERLPWLEPVEDEDHDAYYPEGGGYGGVILAGVAVLLTIALVTAGILWFRHHSAATADIGQIIHAEQGPYKVKPQDPGGMKPDTTERVAADTSAGHDMDAPLDPSAMPEQSMVGPRAQAEAKVTPPPAPPPTQVAQAPVAPKPATPAPPPPAPVAKPTTAPAAPPVAAEPGASGQVQLGAFSSEAKAKAAWKGLSSRFDFLKEMTPVVSPVTTANGTLYRLRASGATIPAGRLCANMKVAGENCSVLGG